MQLIHGDCLVEMQKIPDHSVDMILCDLPYGTTACSWDVVIPFEPLWGQYKRVIKRIGVICLFGVQPFSSLLVVSNLDCFKYNWVWIKSNSNGFQHAKNKPMTIAEDVLVFSNGSMGHVSLLGDKRMSYNPQGVKPSKLRIVQSSWHGSMMGARPNQIGREYLAFTNFPENVLYFESVFHKGIKHPTQKPVSLLEYLIKTYTNEGDLVLDNCMGAGSTGIACLNTNRDFIGIELYPLPGKPISKQNPDYFNIAKNRIAKWKFEPTQDSKEEQINLF